MPTSAAGCNRWLSPGRCHWQHWAAAPAASRAATAVPLGLARRAIQRILAGVRQARLIGDVLTDQHLFIAAKVVDYQEPPPIAQEVAGMLATAAGLVVKHHDKRIAIQVVAAVGPEIGPFGLAFARVQLLYRGFVGRQTLALAQFLRQTVG